MRRPTPTRHIGPRRRIGTALFGLALLAGADAAGAQDRAGWPDAETLARQFDRIAFSSEFGGQYRAGRVIRWQGPILVRIKGQSPARFRAEVEEQMRELSRLSGLPIIVAGDVELGPPRGITIEFSNSRGGTNFEPEAPCRAVIWENGFVIERAEIYIAPSPDSLRRHCIAEETTQALGLADDSTLIRDSIFNDASDRQRLAPWDALMVRILYHPRLRPGMDRAEANPEVRIIIAELLAQGGTSSGPGR